MSLRSLAWPSCSEGLATRAQLLAIGLSATEIQSRIERGLLHPVHRGVHRVGHTAPLEFAAEMAAVLACGHRTVLSGRSAGYVWALLPRPHGPVQVSGAVAASGRASGRAVSQSVARRPLGAGDSDHLSRAYDRRPCGELDPLQLESVVADAERRRLVTERELQVAGRRRGAARLRDLLERDHDPALTRSDTQKRLLRLARAAELPAPDQDVPFGVYELDTVWRDARLVVELDGYEFHRTRAVSNATAPATRNFRRLVSPCSDSLGGRWVSARARARPVGPDARAAIEVIQPPAGCASSAIAPT